MRLEDWSLYSWVVLYIFWAIFGHLKLVLRSWLGLMEWSLYGGGLLYIFWA